MPRLPTPLVALCCCAVALACAATASAADSVWWTGFNAGRLATASLAGGSGANILASPVAAEFPYGSAVDAATGKLYWANLGDDAIVVMTDDAENPDPNYGLLLNERAFFGPHSGI